MEIRHSDYLKENDMVLIKNEMDFWFKHFKIPKKSLFLLSISKRLRAADGVYTWEFNLETAEILHTEIKLSHKHYIKYGIKSLLRVFKHEMAHHFCFMMGESGTKHNKFFLDICLKMDACVNDVYAVGKYSSLKYGNNGINTKYKWIYYCKKCKNVFKTKRKLTNNDIGCYNCKCKISKLKVRKL